jgi:hypothetical protein
MRSLTVLLILLSVTRPAPSFAQAGRLPVLGQVPADAVCALVPLPKGVPPGNVARILKLDSDASQRAIRLALDTGGRPLMLSDRVFGRPNEYEQATAVFRPDGSVSGGIRQYGPPGRRAPAAKDTIYGLQPRDTVDAYRLATAVLKKCAP